MSARCASVSTFCTRVGLPPRPRSDSLGGVAVGAGTPCSIQCTTALASPATNRSAAVRTVTRTRSRRARRRSAAARPRMSRTSRCATITAWLAPTICAASTAPSRTRCGDLAISTLSLALAGSPSVPLPITTGARPAATAASLRAVGNPAPPLPVSPARSTSAISARMSPRPGPGHGGGPYLARWLSRLAGPGGKRRGNAPGAPALDDLAPRPALTALCVTAAPFPGVWPAAACRGAGGRGCAARTAAGPGRRSRPRRRSPTPPAPPTRSAGRCRR